MTLPPFARISCIMPCWQRPQRTARAIRSVLMQPVANWELICIGDACPVLPGAWKEIFGTDDPLVVLPNGKAKWTNLPEHEGKYGTQCLNWGLMGVTGAYVCFLGNDDYLLPTHFESRLNAIEGTDHGFTYHDALIQAGGKLHIRPGHPLRSGQTGGSELTVKAQLAQKIGFQSTQYGHDWTFIEGLLAFGCRYSYSPTATYVVTHLPGQIEEKDID